MPPPHARTMRIAGGDYEQAWAGAFTYRSIFYDPISVLVMDVVSAVEVGDVMIALIAVAGEPGETSEVVLGWHGILPEVVSITFGDCVFKRRAISPIGEMAVGEYNANPGIQRMELWWAPITTPTPSQPIITTLSNSIYFATVALQVIQGCRDPSFPWDPSGALPAMIASVPPTPFTFHTVSGPSSTTVDYVPTALNPLPPEMSSFIYICDAMWGYGAEPVCLELWCESICNRNSAAGITRGLDTDWGDPYQPADGGPLGGRIGTGSSVQGAISFGGSFVGRVAPLDPPPWSGVCIPPRAVNAAPPVAIEEPITAWTLEPDWATGVTERLSWKTDVLPSQTGIEQRRRLRNSPRRQVEAAYTLIGSDRRLYDNLMQGPAAGFWHYPLWWEKFPLAAPGSPDDTVLFVTDTDGTEITSGDKLLVTDRSPFVYEIVTVDSVTSGAIGLTGNGLFKAWPAGTSVYLTKRCRLIAGQRGQRRADDAAQVTLTFETTEPNDYTGIPPTYSLDYPVLELPPNDAEELFVEHKRLLAEFSNDTTSVPIRRDLGGQTFMLQQFAYLTRGRAELAALRGLLYYLQGKLVPVYVPTYTRDVELMPGFFGVAGGTFLAVRRSGYPDYTLEHNASRRLLMLWFRDGAVTVYNVTGAAIVSDDQETLTVDPPLDRGVGNSTVWRMCWMALSRQDQDDIEILHHADGRGPTTMTTTFATLAEGRHAEPYSTNPWNGSFRRTDGVPIPPPPDGGITATDREPLEYSPMDYSGGEGGSGEGSPAGGGGTDSGASGGAAGEGSGGGGPGGGGDAGGDSGEGGDE